ncbi:MAG: hypothetical protein IJ300_11535 [Clostridia bacterium]|nr:hypothetical protein [Clostridia bacterium]
MNKNNTSLKRIASWWLRFEDLNWPHPDAYDRIKRRAEGMAGAGVTTAMIFGAHFRWDFLPYFTLLHDYLAAVADELHKVGVELYDHHSVSLVHRYSTAEEMRNVMLHSGPHLPLSPSREAAAPWEYNGTKLNDWRAVDVIKGSPVYYPQYAAEGFCIRNPHYREAYKTYLKRLIADTNIDGLSADDPVHFMEFRTCGCSYCTEEFRNRTGKELPAVSNTDFWGNWDNPDWNIWLNMRYDAVSDFFKEISSVVPSDFCLTACGGNSASTHAPGAAFDGRRFLSGCNYLNLEMSGNTPPYKNDSKTANATIASKMIAASHHQGAARNSGIRCFGTGFGFTEPTADIVWAVNKMLGADCWFSTLKDRLGLPEHILKTLPDESDVVGRAFRFEKEHPCLFDGEQIGQVGVFFSEETRDHTFFGNVNNGYCKDYGSTIKLLFENGISGHTIFEFPERPEEYPLILISSAVLMTEKEIQSLRKFLQQGGKVIATGPCGFPGCEGEWDLPSKPEIEKPEDFFGTAQVYYQPAKWKKETHFTPSAAPIMFKEIIPAFYYTPHRISDGEITELFLESLRKYMKQLPIKFICSNGYLINMFENKNTITVHLLAEDFETDIDHHLDEIRFHRSRVNYINKVEPAGVTQTLQLKANGRPAVYTPFNVSVPTVSENGNEYKISLPEKASYVILQFSK